jgi:hypothetical protein
MSQIRELYETFLCQIYSLPINQEHFPMNFISFDDTQKLFKQKQINKFEINPSLQVWSGDPNSQNRIISLHTKTGENHLVKALYHPETKQIYPPVL